LDLGLDPEPLRSEVLSILSARVDATEKLQSYDFMSKETIQQFRKFEKTDED